MRKERAKDETREILLGCIIVLLIIAVFSLFSKISHNKYNLVETYLSSDYYSKEHLREAMANQLGEQCEESDSNLIFFSKNFDNYVYSLVLEDINRYEDEKIAKYNAYMNSEKAKKVLEQIEEPKRVTVEKMDSICYVKMPGFYNGFTYKDLLQYKTQLKESRKFIIDLRDNSGGSTDELIDVLSLFYEEGREVYSLIENDKVTKSKTKKEKQVDFEKIIFLCNKDTASAAEAMIFNMKSDFADKVEIVGQKTYGKNFCYAYKEFDDGELLMFVTGFMGNAAGKTFSIEGIEPDYVIEDSKCIEKAKELLNGE